MDWGVFVNGTMVLVTVTIAGIAWWTYLSQTCPRIILYTHHDYLRRGYLIIRIHNIGKDVAKDLSFEIESPLPDIRSPLLNNLPSLAPGEYREFGWGVVWNLKKNTSGSIYKIKYRYYQDRKVLWRKRLHGEDIIETDSYDEELLRLSPYQDIVKAIGEAKDKLNDVSVLSREWKEYLASHRCDDK